MYKKIVFQNGLRLISIPMNSTETVTVLALVGVGSKYETKKNNGISHFLEHMLFKGTKKRPNKLAIAESLDMIGGQYNGFTSWEYTGFWAKVDSKHLDLAIDWVSDILLNSKLESKDIDKERGVIAEEINMYLDNPMEHVEDLWAKILYGNQPAGWSVLGKKSIINKLKRKDFIKYLKDHYSSKNTIIAVSGKICRDLPQKIRKYFGNIRTNKPADKRKTIEKQNRPRAIIHYKKTDQTHFRLGVRTFDISNENKYILDLLTVILGKGMSSRLFMSVREEQGLAYYIYSDSDYGTDAGYFYTQAGVNNKKVEKAIQIILRNYKLIKNKKVSQRELQKAKDYIKGRTILGIESSDKQASFYAFQELLENKILTPEEIFDKIDKVNADDIRNVANEIFRPERLNLALIGPFRDSEKFEKLLIV